MDALIVFGAKYLIWIEAVAALVWLLRAHNRTRTAVFAALSLALSYLAGKAASLLWYNPRPFVEGNFAPLIAHAANNGFPSDHMLFAAAMAATVTYFDRRWGAVLWIMAILVGLARVLAGLHHVTDIAASAVIAVIAVMIIGALFKRFRKTANL